MIASIRGLLAIKTTSQLVVEVGGIGYAVNVTGSTSAKLTTGSDVHLHTAFIVREDAMTLYGFITSLEQELFDLLRSVTGVGPKSALAILGTLSTAEIASAVALDNDAAFKSVSGIGPKTAKLITVTLAGKLSHLVLDQEIKASETDFGSVVEALVSLGWAEKQAQEAVRSVAATLETNAGRDLVLRQALSLLGSSKAKSGN